MSTKRRANLLGLMLALMISPTLTLAQGVKGYYQQPDLHGNTLVFVAEGDLWKVPVGGGLAQRLTTHLEEESHPAISPDGRTIAYSATYEGPREVYTLPIEGGVPTRWTFGADESTVTSWTPDGKIVYQTNSFSQLHNLQLLTIDLSTKKKAIVPLFSASEGVQNDSASWLFVRPAYTNVNTKRYVGGQASQIWTFDGNNEAIKLTADHPGQSHNPMWYQGRVYFITDRDGMMNIWSMDAKGGDLQQHTRHDAFDVRSANLDQGRIVYQHAADLWLLDIATGEYEQIDIRLATDLEQMREQWVEDPAPYITSVQPDPTGERVVVTARGRIGVVPVKAGRTVSFAGKNGVRYRDAVFSHDGQHIITLSDESGEFEFVQFAADGMGKTQALTQDSALLRYQGIPSPDGKWIAYDDLDKNMYVLKVATGASKKISTNQEGIRDFSWSPDGQWLAFVEEAMNGMKQIKVYNVNDGALFDLTTDRANSVNPCWSPDGKFIYFLSDRNFRSLVTGPGDVRQPDPYFDDNYKVFHVALQAGTRSPFREKDELMDEPEKGDTEKAGKPSVVRIDQAGIQARIAEVPVPAGNYRNLAINGQALYMIASGTGAGATAHLKVVNITDEDAAVSDMASGVSGFTLTQDGRKLLVRKGSSYFMVEAGTGSVNLEEGKIDLSSWTFSINPREDWQQIYRDAWRMERDYFYDPNMHGVDWEAMYDKYLPLVDRVTTRRELDQIIGELIGELSVLHTSVDGGDERSDDSYVSVASLGAETSRDEGQGGFRIDYIYKTDPDYPHRRSPLDDPYLDIREGDIITHVNGKEALSASDMGELLRNQAGKQVRLKLKRGASTREVIVKPIGHTYWLRYYDGEYARRLEVEEKAGGQIGYLHLWAMTDWNIGQFYRQFYPVFNRQGLIIDLRNNNGGHIDAFILEKLTRQAWMYWTDRVGEPYWNMHHAFRGHMVLLINDQTGSDGETFAEGFKRLGLGTVIGTRTWGGQVWLNSANRLTDNGRASAPMHGVYGPEGKWLVEGHGVEPDIVLDNLPHASFLGEDAQLTAAIKLLQQKIAEDPREVPPVPAYPDKSFQNNRRE